MAAAEIESAIDSGAGEIESAIDSGAGEIESAIDSVAAEIESATDTAVGVGFGYHARVLILGLVSPLALNSEHLVELTAIGHEHDLFP